MTEVEWRGPVNQILYGIIYTPILDDKAVDEMAKAMVEHRYFVEGPQRYAEAIPEALKYTEPLADAFETPHSEEQFRDFLARVAKRLESLKPWPKP
jgi:hypothetical protein